MALIGTSSAPKVRTNADGTITMVYDMTTTSTGANVWTLTSKDGGTTWSTTTNGGEWMAHPMTSEEIIEDFAKKLARLRPA